MSIQVGIPWQAITKKELNLGYYTHTHTLLGKAIKDIFNFSNS